MLQDLAILTNGKVISEQEGMKLENTNIEDLGRAGRIIATKDHTTLVDTKGTKKDINTRLAQLKKILAETNDKADQTRIKNRIGRLSGGVGVIKVGAATEAELRYKRFKIEDALAATKAAIQEGIIPGGATSLIKVQDALIKYINESDYPTAVKIGMNLVAKVLEEPFKQISRNAGIDDPLPLIEEIKKDDVSGFDFNELDNSMLIKSSRKCDLFKKGIIDPLKVVRTALENAVSMAGMFLTTETAIMDDLNPEDKRFRSSTKK